MILHFTKMQGCGNDYIYIAAAQNPAIDLEKLVWEQLSPTLSDRHFGIGSDGVVLILPSEEADYRMRIFNADGSEAEMCGNASRCIGRYVSTMGLSRATRISLQTGAGIKYLDLLPDGLVRVDMGTELGNPHEVNFVDEVTDALVLEHGPIHECDPRYPNRTNVEFAAVQDRHHIRLGVWERGSGMTLACGTGACATARAAVQQGLCDSPVIVMLPGGELSIEVSEDGHMYMTGPAEIVYSGTIRV